MSFFNDASLVFLPSGAAGKDGKAYSIKPVPEFGSEKVTNGTFSTDSDWTKGTGWTISGGTASCDGSQSGNSILYQNISHSANKKYRVEFTISGYVSGQVDFALDTPFFGATTSNGTFIFYAIPPSGGNFIIRADADFVGSIDNVSVKEITKTGDFTFSRGSNLAATRVGADGLIEKGRENLWLQSTALGTSPNATTSAASITGGQSGYDGSTDAWELESLSDGFYRRLYQSTTQTGVITFSIYAKASATNFLLLYNTQNGDRAWFDLSSGSLGTLNGAIDSSIEDIGSGWYRCSISLNTTISSTIWICPANANNIASCDLGNSILLQDAQLEIGLAATDYIESGATTGKAGLLEDEPRFDYSGGATCPSLLLEPSRTNLFTQSEYFNSSDWIKSNVTATNNSAISPDGLQNATLINDGTASGTQHWFYQSITLSSGTTYTISFYAKYVDRKNMFINIYDGATSNFVYYDIQNGVVLNANGNAVRDIVDVGSGWYRITYTRTIVGSGANFRIGMANDTPVQTYTGENKEALIYGLQLEAGSYPTSYIPNHSGGSVTRGFDYSIVESLGYSSTCTFYYEFNTTTGRETSSPFAEIGKDQSNKIWIKGASANGPQFSVQGNGIFSGSISPTNEVSGTNKIAVQWSSGVGVVFSNGVKQSGTLTNSNTSENIDFIAAKGQGTSHDSKQLLFFEEALSDADCITLTTL